ncbi:MAG TPA: hypothetical protein VIH57_01895 [Bacteroidales bacterium]
MKKHIYHITVILFIASFIYGCSKDDLFDIVIGGQPAFVGNHQFAPGLNIFGVIRPDSLDAKSMNLIHVEKVIPAVSDTEDSTTVSDFKAVIYKTNNNVVIDSLCFTYTYPDTTFTHQPDDFIPMPGNRFKISCQSPGLPVLSAETIIPNQPVIVGDIINSSNNKAQFSILSDTTAFLYDIYLLAGSNQYYQRILRAKTGNTTVEIAANLSVGSNAQLLIYAYDKNLSAYLTAPNLFVKPNTYRPPFSTVQNGYGCFGSLNLLRKELQY